VGALDLILLDEDLRAAIRARSGATRREKRDEPDPTKRGS